MQIGAIAVNTVALTTVFGEIPLSLVVSKEYAPLGSLDSNITALRYVCNTIIDGFDKNKRALKYSFQYWTAKNNVTVASAGFESGNII